MSKYRKSLTVNIILFTIFYINPACYASYSTSIYKISNSKNSHTPSQSLLVSANQPIPSKYDQGLSSDIRIKFDISGESNQHEINLGLATRKETTFFGATEFGYYAFWDISHIRNQVFAQQATLGLELLSQKSHIATNLYIPQMPFTTEFDLKDQLDTYPQLVKTQQIGILQTVDTLPGFDINLNHDISLNNFSNIGIDFTYFYFNKNLYTEQGPKIGIQYNNKTTQRETSYTLFGSFDNYHKGSIGLNSSIQWQKRKAQVNTRKTRNRTRIRDIDIRTTPLDNRQFIRVKEKFGPLEWNTTLHDYLKNNYQILPVTGDEESDILVIGPAWMWVANIDKNEEEIQKQIDSIKKEKAKIKIFWTGEAANSKPREEALDVIDLMIGFDYSDHPKYYRMPLIYFVTAAKNLKFNFDPNTDLSGENMPLFRKEGCNPDAKKYFACFLQRNANTRDFNNIQARMDLLDELSEYKFVASGGPSRNNVQPIPEFNPISTITWESQCKFMIAYENQHHSGYVTEKPFYPWLAGAIPLYDAHPSVKEDFNSKALLFRGDYDSVESYINEIKRLDQDNKAYCDMWNTHILQGPHQDYQVIYEALYNRFDSIFSKKNM